MSQLNDRSTGRFGGIGCNAWTAEYLSKKVARLAGTALGSIHNLTFPVDPGTTSHFPFPTDRGQLLTRDRP